MPTLVLRRGHVNRRASMATAEYRRGHGTLIIRSDNALAVGWQAATAAALVQREPGMRLRFEELRQLRTRDAEAFRGYREIEFHGFEEVERFS